MRKICKNSLKHSRNIKKIIWFTGLSGSGKTTLGIKLVKYLRSLNYSAIYLDGDDMRGGLSKDLSFTDDGRHENIRRVAELSKLLIKQTNFIVVTTISPNDKVRNLAKKIIGRRLFNLVYLSTPIKECIRRDPKGHYQRAYQGKIQNFTGISSLFEAPKASDLEIDTSKMNQKVSLQKLKELLNLT